MDLKRSPFVHAQKKFMAAADINRPPIPMALYSASAGKASAFLK